MNKGFNFHILGNMLSDFSDFFQRQFSGSYHTFCSQPVPEPVGFIIGVVCLGTDVTFNFRTNFLRISKNSRICNDQRIRFQPLQLLKVLPNAWKVVIMSKNIYSHINLYAVLVSKSNPLCHIFSGKVFCFCPKTKSFSADIHSICPKYYCNFQDFQTAGRYQ